MPRHRARTAGPRWLLPAVVVSALMALALVGGLVLAARDRAPGRTPVGATPCDRTVRVLTATSFAPVLTAVAPALERGADCVRIEVTVADGRAAAQQVSRSRADVWIPDDALWVGSATGAQLAEAPRAGAGTVLATSPVYMLTDDATAARMQESGGGSWLGLADLVAQQDTGITLAVRDPAGSGDGMLAVATPAEAVWLERDMDASALWLSRAQQRTRTATGAAALPEKPGEVALVPEHALLPALQKSTVPGTILAGSDYTAELRYTWLPTAGGVADPDAAEGLARLLRELRGPAAAGALATAYLRAPGAALPPADGAGRLPKLTGKPLETLKPHHVDHVYTTWYRADRRTGLLIVVDVSGSMAKPAPGSDRPLIDLVRDGCRSVVDLLPDDAQLGLWEFGVKLDGAADHRQLAAAAALDAGQRAALVGQIDKLAAKETGTGLYDTILAAYVAARDRYQPGMPNQVLVFTDGRNEDDPNSRSLAQLREQLAAAKDPKRPVQLSVAAFGQREEAELLRDAVKPVDGYVDALASADEVAAVFIHVAAGGLHN